MRVKWVETAAAAAAGQAVHQAEPEEALPPVQEESAAAEATAYKVPEEQEGLHPADLPAPFLQEAATVQEQAADSVPTTDMKCMAGQGITMSRAITAVRDIMAGLVHTEDRTTMTEDGIARPDLIILPDHTSAEAVIPVPAA